MPPLDQQDDVNEDGNLPLVMLGEGEYEVIRARDRGQPTAGRQGGGFPEKPRTVLDKDFDERVLIPGSL